MVPHNNPKLQVSFAPATQSTLTTGEKLGVLLTLAKLLVSFPFIILSLVVRDKSKTKGWQFELRNRIMRFCLSRISARQINLVQKPTAKSVAAYAQTAGVKVTTEETGHGGRLHWFGEKKGVKALLHFHGGGYNLPLGDHHMAYLHRTQKRLAKKGTDVDLAFLEYGLTPTSRYPTQLKQAVEALRHIIDSGYDPSNIIISGDSAGGCLAISTISHILHPHPAIQPLILPESSPKIAGVLPISPWTSFSREYPSFLRPSGRDIIFNHHVDWWERWYIDRPSESANTAGEAEGESKGYTWDEYNQPVMADKSWWTGYPAEKVCVLIGDDEVLRDAILDFAGKFTEGVGAGSGTSVNVVLCEREIHTECLYDMKVPAPPGKMANEGWAFFEEVFKVT